ncbi:hypothetical protein IT774_05095 [Salinimonas marina]|uniref:Uncharacterized protein n=1 Tax=Salinimonas marina TaxID=2785918 RepID=A0A7S9E028_9ALTE|nr:hypothetical protein [Salinimonas marina]QPG06550.1 hypothetical protein IT774_05095 [Salinimonas marina]
MLNKFWLLTVQTGPLKFNVKFKGKSPASYLADINSRGQKVVLTHTLEVGKNEYDKLMACAAVKDGNL